ncbi:MAG TPA: hypothetical protein VID27_10925 [Blastocatellia bacterium]|jgi:hypothetical protein
MEKSNSFSLKIDKTALSIKTLREESDDKAYWLSKTPQERLQHIEILRRINYGDRATARLQRVLEVVKVHEDK